MLNIIFEGLFALFAAVGAVTIVWLIIGVFIQPEECKGICVYTVVAAHGECDDLKKVVKSVLWRQDMIPEDREIILCGDISDSVRHEIEDEIGHRIGLCTLTCEEIGYYLKNKMP